jgi:ectoine hydroxylase-related dioxygenase (phytanoyl-CoA dioxygenase family)
MTSSTSTPVNALRTVPANSTVDEIRKVVAEDGGVVIKGFLTQDQIDRFNAEIEPAMQALSAGSDNADSEIADFHGTQTKRLTNLVTISKTFREEIVDHDLLHALGEATYREESGDWWMTTAQLIEIGPGNKAQVLHRDLEQFIPFIGMGPAGPEVMCNFLIAMTDFTDENGATRVIPGSNHWADYEDRGTPEMTLPAEMKAGDVIFFTGKLVHGGGANRTENEFRRGLTIPLQPGYLTPEEPYNLITPLDIVRTLSPRVQKMLGFRSLYPKGSPGLLRVNYHELADFLEL